MITFKFLKLYCSNSNQILQKEYCGWNNVHYFHVLLREFFFIVKNIWKFKKNRSLFFWKRRRFVDKLSNNKRRASVKKHFWKLKKFLQTTVSQIFVCISVWTKFRFVFSGLRFRGLYCRKGWFWLPIYLTEAQIGMFSTSNDDCFENSDQMLF